MTLQIDYGPAFERFWRAYPKKVAKGDAYKAFQKLKLGEDEVDELVIHLERRKKEDVNWIEGRYVPHAGTFLRQHRWLDEYKKVRQQSPSHAPVEESRTMTDEEWERSRRRLEQIKAGRVH